MDVPNPTQLALVVQSFKLQSSGQSSWQLQPALQSITFLVSPVQVEAQPTVLSQVSATHWPATHILLVAQSPVSTHLLRAGLPLANLPVQLIHHSQPGVEVHTPSANPVHEPGATTTEPV